MAPRRLRCAAVLGEVGYHVVAGDRHRDREVTRLIQRKVCGALIGCAERSGGLRVHAPCAGAALRRLTGRKPARRVRGRQGNRVTDFQVSEVHARVFRLEVGV